MLNGFFCGILPQIFLRLKFFMNNLVYLLLGGNQGNVKESFAQTLLLIEEFVGNVVDHSPIYKTEPWGFQCDNPFLNQVIMVNTDLDPGQLLKMVLMIEEKMGRKRESSAGKYSSRPIDIDILFYNDFIIESEDLIVPHPRLHRRNFALIPLNDLSPELCHPLLKKTVAELVISCDDSLSVVKYADETHE
ncbi:MAG: 2-amino-4-hydroxy-6-hydroxymethyldihydropteridine diphosphokinase [Bacteroidetes bacterium]|nr:MAG: 2-amino-4-hydroxy-6-hydroxymethyldihydropteridine diphosphokinase [Bacteroidota bacterium]